MNTKEQLKNYLANYFTQSFAYLDSGDWKEPVGVVIANTLHSLFRFWLVPMGAAVSYLPFFIIDFLICSIPSIQFKFKELLDTSSEDLDSFVSEPESISPEFYEHMQQLHNCPNPGKSELSNMFKSLLDFRIIRKISNNYKVQKEVLSKLLKSKLLDVAPF